MSKTISLAEVVKHNSEGSCWMVIHNNVYDLTKFLDEHPGGADSLLEVAGKDGTQGFEDVGHSDDAREMMKKYQIGTLPEGEVASNPCQPDVSVKSSTKDPEKIAKAKPVKTKVETKPEKERCAHCLDHEAKIRGRGDDGSWKKYALLALIAAVAIGLIIKMKSG